MNIYIVIISHLHDLIEFYILLGWDRVRLSWYDLGGGQCDQYVYSKEDDRMHRAVQGRGSVLLPLESASFLTDQLEAPWIHATQHRYWQACLSTWSLPLMTTPFDCTPVNVCILSATDSGVVCGREKQRPNYAQETKTNYWCDVSTTEGLKVSRTSHLIWDISERQQTDTRTRL